MSPQSDYLQAVRERLNAPPFDPIKDLLRARLYDQPVHGVSSPALTREEPDRTVLLVHLYDQEFDAENTTGLQRLRRAAVELVQECLFGAWSVTDFRDRARLVGAFEVQQDPALADSLRLHLWGYLQGGLPKPPEQMAHLEGWDLERARLALDLWLAVTPVGHEPPGHVRATLIEWFGQTLNALTGQNSSRVSYTPPRFELLLLLYRGLLKLAPKRAGMSYHEIHTYVWELRDRDEPCGANWLALCWEYGLVLSGYSSLGALLYEGLSNNALTAQERRKRAEDTGREAELFWRGIGYLTGTEAADRLRKAWQPGRPALTSVPIEKAA